MLETIMYIIFPIWGILRINEGWHVIRNQSYTYVTRSAFFKEGRETYRHGRASLPPGIQLFVSGILMILITVVGVLSDVFDSQTVLVLCLGVIISSELIGQRFSQRFADSQDTKRKQKNG